MKKSWITKTDISQILKTYSIRKDEFEPVSNINYCYKSKSINGYMITISKDQETNRIMVSHSQDNGKRTYIDVWERTKDNKLHFRFRNLWNQPFSDADYIKDLEYQIKELKQAGRELQMQIQNNHKLINDTIEPMQTELVKHNIRNAGRKPSQERLNAIEQMKTLLKSGFSDQEIMDNFSISRATFYRYKKCINN